MITNLNERAEIRTVEDDETGELFYSLVDVIYVFRDCYDRDIARNYWAVMKNRLGKKKFTHSMIECFPYKAMANDGKYRNTDFADFKHVAALIEFMSFSKVRLTNGRVFTPNISSDRHHDCDEYVSQILAKYTQMPRTKINYEDGCDDPNNFEYLQDACSGYAFDSDYGFNNEFEYSNALTNQNTYKNQDTYKNQNSEKPSDKSVEEFLAYLDSLVKMG